MKISIFAGAADSLRMIHDDLCDVWRRLEDEQGMPGRRRLAKEFDEVIESVDGLICRVKTADRVMNRQRRVSAKQLKRTQKRAVH